MKPIRIALLFAQSDANATLSYQHSWPRALSESSQFKCSLFNLAGRSLLDTAGMATQIASGTFDAIVMLHSTFSNCQELRRLLFHVVARVRVPKAYFIGNEYKLMPEKIDFCRKLGVTLLISQSNDEQVLNLYRDALDCRVASIPNTGIDQAIFFPTTELSERRLDIGYRSFDSPWYLGNNEKLEISDYFQANADRLKLKVNISMDIESRFDAVGYADFLNQCRGQISTEPGGDFFELTDNVRLRVNAYMNSHPNATWSEVKSQFFSNYGPSIPMRIISGRHVEAAACKTVQILFEGRYNGYFQPDEHYIPLQKDFGNIDEVMHKFRDDSYCERIINNAYDVVRSDLTYDRLIDKFSAEMREIL
jgi:hypothetical protein